MRELPDGWVDPGEPEQTTPLAVAVFDGTWPPADDDTPAGTTVLNSWSVDRQLRASSLVGQIRAATGFATADAKCSFTPPQGGLIAPWLHGDATVVPPSRAQLRISQDGRPGAMVMGSFDVDPISSSLSAPEITLDMIEALTRLNRPQNLPAPGWFLDDTQPVGDAIWAVDHVARQAGFYSTPAPVASCIGSLPLQGSNQPEVGLVLAQQLPSTAWEKHPELGITPTANVVGDTEYLTFTNRNAAKVYVAVSFVGTVFLAVRVTEGKQFAVKITDAGLLGVATATNSTFTNTTTFVPGLDEDHPHRVVVEIDLSDPNGGQVRAKSTDSVAWSSVLLQGSTVTGITDDLMVQARDASVFNALQVATADDPGLWAVTNADLELLDNPITSFWAESTTTARQIIDGYVGASLGATWVDVDGTLIVRGRTYLRGAAPTVDVIDVGAQFADLKWVVDPAETADRVVVKYRPTVFVDEASEVWSASDPYYVGQRGTLTITVPIDAMIYGTPSATWKANRKSDGTGAVAAADDLDVYVTTRTMSTATIIIHNQTSVGWYIVGDSGSPELTLSADVAVRTLTEDSVAIGVSEALTVRPLEVDLGIYAQDRDYVWAIADMLAKMTRRPGWRVERATVRFDPRRDIGDIVRLQAADYGLDVKAIVSGIHTSVSAGQPRQDLDLVILPFIIYDLNNAWDDAIPNPLIADFNARWAGLAIGDFNRAPLSTTT